jgi:hypothetical protein
MKILSQHFAKETEENHENPQNILSLGQDSNMKLLKYVAGVLAVLN